MAKKRRKEGKQKAKKQGVTVFKPDKWKGGDRPNVLFVTADQWGCGHYRIIWPAQKIAQMGLANVNIIVAGEKEFRFDDYSDPKLKWADVCIFQRVLDDRVMATILHQRDKFNYSLFYEIDDDIDAIDRSNPSYDAFMGRGKERVTKTYHKALKDVDCVVTSTKPLADVCVKYAGQDNVVIMKNAVDFNRLFLDNVFNEDIVRLLWWGGNAHLDDLNLALPALHQMMAKYDSLHLFFWGFSPDLNTTYAKIQHGGAHMRKIGVDGSIEMTDVALESFNKLLAKYRGRIKFYPFQRSEIFHAIMPTFNADIGMAPIVDNQFNRAKSNLKFIEQSAMYIPMVASNVYPYANTITHGEDGFLAKKHVDWVKYLDMLISDSSLRKEMGQKAHKLVKTKYNMEDVALSYMELFKKVHFRPKKRSKVDWFASYGVKKR